MVLQPLLQKSHEPVKAHLLHPHGDTEMLLLLIDPVLNLRSSWKPTDSIRISSTCVCSFDGSFACLLQTKIIICRLLIPERCWWLLLSIWNFHVVLGCCVYIHMEAISSPSLLHSYPLAFLSLLSPESWDPRKARFFSSCISFLFQKVRASVLSKERISFPQSLFLTRPWH